MDDVVIARERWVLEPAELSFLREASEFDQFQGARRLRLVLGMPERVFVRTPEEPKPFFVDFSSPLLIQMWAGMARDGSGAVVSEMLPDLTEGWLTDASDNVYTPSCDWRSWRMRADRPRRRILPSTLERLLERPARGLVRNRVTWSVDPAANRAMEQVAR